MRVFVTGGTGFVGTDVTRRLVAAGHQVFLLARKPDAVAIEGAHLVKGSIENPASWESALRECDACVHMVGILRERPEQGITFEKLHYQATMDLVRACGKTGVRRFIYLSANGVEKRIQTAYMRTKATSEQAVRSSSLEWTILRPSVIYGGRSDRMNFMQILRSRMDAAPAFPYFGDGAYRLAPISTWEVGESVVAALQDEQSIGKTYHLCGAETYTYKAMLHLMAEAGKYKITLFPLPFWLMNQVASLLGGFQWFPLTSGMLRMLKEGNDCPPGASTQRDLKVPAISFRDWLTTGALPKGVTAKTSLQDSEGESAPKVTRHLDESASFEPKLTKPLDADVVSEPKITRPLD